MGRNYERLDIKRFGEHLLETGDLDPIYIMLEQAALPPDQLNRWLLAYWCFYHAGFASYASDHTGLAYWRVMETAAENAVPAPPGCRWPRGHERRHFRGAAAVRAISKLRSRYSKPEEMVDYLLRFPPSYEAVANAVREHVLFGPWIAFKVADMIDRVLGVHVDFTEAAVFMFTDPRAAALRLWRAETKMPETARPRDENAVIAKVVEHLREQFKGWSAPPLYDRPVGLQEIETILCKWKSHMNGHYPLLNDITEIGAGLSEWAASSPTCRVMLGVKPFAGRAP